MFRQIDEEATQIAWTALLGLVVAKVLLHLFSIDQYGYFRDELYYLVSTDHLI